MVCGAINRHLGSPRAGGKPDRQSRNVGKAIVAELEQRLRRGGRILVVKTIDTPTSKRIKTFYRPEEFMEEARLLEDCDERLVKLIFAKGL